MYGITRLLWQAEKKTRAKCSKVWTLIPLTPIRLYVFDDEFWPLQSKQSNFIKSQFLSSFTFFVFAVQLDISFFTPAWVAPMSHLRSANEGYKRCLLSRKLRASRPDGGRRGCKNTLRYLRKKTESLPALVGGEMNKDLKTSKSKTESATKTKKNNRKLVTN